MKGKLIFILLLNYFALYAQTDLVWQNYTTENGLPQNSVKDIITDKYGFLWIATENGITRFDGSQFVTTDEQYNKQRYRNFWGNIEKDTIFNVDEQGSTTLLISKRMPQEKVWFTKYLKTTTIYNGVKYALYNKNNAITPRMDREFLFINIGKYIYFIGNNLITIHDPLTNTGKKMKAPFNMRLWKNMFMHNNTVFVSISGQKKILKINNGQFSQIECSSIYTDPESIIYWSQGNQKVYIINKDIIYKSTYKDDKLGAEKITIIPNLIKKFKALTIKSMVYDEKSQHLFLGSSARGLFVITIPQFSSPVTESAFDSNVFYSTLPFNSNSVMTPQGNIYDSTSQIITPRRPDNKDMYHDYKKYSLAINNAKDIFFIKNGMLYKRLRKYNYNKSVKVPAHEEIDVIFNKDEQIYLTYIKNNKYYLAKYDDNLQKTTPLFYFNYPIYDVKKYNNQQLLIAGFDGLYIGDSSKKEIKKILNYHSKRIIQTSDRNIWILTKNHGFYLLRKNMAVRMPVDENSYLLDPHTILEDHMQNLWISTNNGLFKVRIQNLLQFSKHLNKSVGYYRYTDQDGLPTNEFNGGGNPNGNILSNGQMVFPSMNGLVFFRPDKVKSFYLKSTDFYIDRAHLDGHQITIKNNILNIPNNDFNVLEIFVDFPYFNNFNNVDLHVAVDNGKWIDLGVHRKHTVGKLTPGNHKVIFRYLDANNNYIYKTVDVKIGFFFYQSQYFKIAVIATSLFLAFLVVKFNERRFKSKNELLAKANTEIDAQKEEINSSNIIREKLIEAISHDIATPIKHLSHLSKKLNDTDSLEIQKKYFHSIHKSSELLYRFTLELGNYAFLFTNTVEETVSYLLNDLLMEKKVFFENIAQDNNTTITFNPKDELYIQTNKSVLAAIIHNIIDNAVKNTIDGHILIEMTYDNSFIYIQITDDGNGMSPEQIYYYNNLHSILIEDVQLQKKGSGYGLKFVLLLIEKIKSQITFNNNTPQGTKIEIKIPN
jgi:signal transduction histidine kinase